MLPENWAGDVIEEAGDDGEEKDVEDGVMVSGAGATGDGGAVSSGQPGDMGD